jgi:hypothetical protein
VSNSGTLPGSKHCFLACPRLREPGASSPIADLLDDFSVKASLEGPAPETLDYQEVSTVVMRLSIGMLAGVTP